MSNVSLSSVDSTLFPLLTNRRSNDCDNVRACFVTIGKLELKSFAKFSLSSNFCTRLSTAERIQLREKKILLRRWRLEDNRSYQRDVTEEKRRRRTHTCSSHLAILPFTWATSSRGSSSLLLVMKSKRRSFLRSDACWREAKGNSRVRRERKTLSTKSSGIFLWSSSVTLRIASSYFTQEHLSRGFGALAPWQCRLSTSLSAICIQQAKNRDLSEEPAEIFSRKSPDNWL